MSDNRDVVDGTDLPWVELAGRRLTVPEVVRRARRFERHRLQEVASVAPERVRDAETLVLVVESEDEAAVVITKRPATMTYHRDDWVFPGGRVDPELDEVAGDAARREGSEELGVPVEAIDLVARLDSHGPVVTGFLIHVFVGVLQAGVSLRPHPDEVAAVEVVPLSHLSDPRSLTLGGQIPDDHDPGPTVGILPSRRRPLPTQPGHGMPFFAVSDGESLWGTQGSIVWNFLTQLARGRSDEGNDPPRSG